MSDISIQLEETALRPGESVRGTVRWSAAHVDSVEISVVWFTNGKGDMNHHTADSLTVSAPATTGTQNFSFKLPESPYSFSGKLVSLVWAIEAVLSPDEESERCEFTLSPNGREVVLT